MFVAQRGVFRDNYVYLFGQKQKDVFRMKTYGVYAHGLHD